MNRALAALSLAARSSSNFKPGREAARARGALVGKSSAAGSGGDRRQVTRGTAGDGDEGQEAACEASDWEGDAVEAQYQEPVAFSPVLLVPCKGRRSQAARPLPRKILLALPCAFPPPSASPPSNPPPTADPPPPHAPTSPLPPPLPSHTSVGSIGALAAPPAPGPPPGTLSGGDQAAGEQGSIPGGHARSTEAVVEEHAADTAGGEAVAAEVAAGEEAVPVEALVTSDRALPGEPAREEVVVASGGAVCQQAAAGEAAVIEQGGPRVESGSAEVQPPQGEGVGEGGQGAEASAAGPSEGSCGSAPAVYPGPAATEVCSCEVGSDGEPTVRQGPLAAASQASSCSAGSRQGSVLSRSHESKRGGLSLSAGLLSVAHFLNWSRAEGAPLVDTTSRAPSTKE